MLKVGLTMALAMTATADRASFTTYALGSSESDFRAHVPSGDKPTRVACNGDVAWLTPSEPAETVCSFEEEYSPTHWSRHSLKLSDTVSATVEFSFFEQKLVKIETYLDAINAEVVNESLEAKFGKPTLVETKPFQVRSGATFSQVVKTWTKGGDAVVMRAPDLNTKRMSVIYLDTAAWARLKAQHKPATIM